MIKPSLRRRAREKLVQAIYQWQVNPDNVTDIEQQYINHMNLEKIDLEYFREILHALTAAIVSLDQKLIPKLDRNIESLSPVEHAILRLGTYELQNRKDVPTKVVINEAIELCKKFGGPDSHKYINSVLDKLAKEMRAD